MKFNLVIASCLLITFVNAQGDNAQGDYVYDIDGQPLKYGETIYINADAHGYWSTKEGEYISFKSDIPGASNYCISDLSKDTCHQGSELRVGDKFTLLDNATGKSLCKRVGSGYIISYDGSRNIEECTFDLQALAKASAPKYAMHMPDDSRLPVSQYSEYVFASTNYDPLTLTFKKFQ